MPYKEGKKFRAVVKHQGQRYTSLHPTKRLAKAWEEEKRKDLKRQSKNHQSGLNYEDLCVKYLSYSTRFSKTTYKEKELVCKRTLSFWGNHIFIYEITPEKVLNYLTAQAETRSANGYNKDRKNLLAMWGWGCKFLEIKDNPVSIIEKLPHDRATQYTPPQEDVMKIFMAATPEEKVFLDAYLNTAARRSEIFRWTWTEDINFERKEVRLGSRKTRDGSMEWSWLPMNEALYKSLKWWWGNRPLKSSPYVFVVLDKRSPHYGKPYTTRRKFMSGICKRAGVKPFGFHALRRYVASVLADTHKVSAKTIQRILRHKALSTTERYIHNINRDLKSTMNLLGQNNDEDTSEKSFSSK